jgi:hypothetical protein
LEKEKHVVLFVFQLAVDWWLVEDHGLSVGGVMVELESDGGRTAVRLDEQLFMMMQLPSTWQRLLIHRSLF